jgi:hypothetical protein
MLCSRPIKMMLMNKMAGAVARDPVLESDAGNNSGFGGLFPLQPEILLLST